jgi:hypothetical protein
MKALTTAIAAIFFTASASASAANKYNGCEHGNRDLFGGQGKTEQVTAGQPSVGDSFDRYHGWFTRNPDIFRATPSEYKPSRSPDYYGTFDDGNVDL